jgi:hypothetical protein
MGRAYRTNWGHREFSENIGGKAIGKETSRKTRCRWVV